MAHNLEYYLSKSSIVNNDIRYMDEDVKQQVKALVPNCNGNLRECFYWIINKLSDYPLCPVCNKPFTSKSFLNGVKGYRTFCSKSCMAKSDQVKEAYKATCLKKYGVEHAFSSQHVQDKRQETNLLTYGDKNPGKWSSDVFKDRMIAKYGVASSLLVPEIKERVTDAIRKAYIDSGKLDERLSEIKEYEDVSLLDTYTGHDVSMNWVHNECGTKFLSNLADGKMPSCPKCNAKSKPEYELFKVVESFVGVGNAIRNDRTAIKPFELDVYVPSLNVAFEMNGNYYHSELFLKDKAKSYHTYKSEMCASVGIKLIQIFDDEWQSKRKILINKIENTLGKSKKMYARKLSVCKVNSESKDKFLSKNHLQGNDISKIAYSLVDDQGIIYSMMTFCKPRFSKQYEWELSRFTNDTGITVVGGASRLLKTFIKEHKPSSIVTYADARFSDGNFYKTLGFTALHRSPPNYWYIKGGLKISRYQAQKHLLSKLLGVNNFDPNLTELENMNNNKWYRLYDCGNYVFELKALLPD